MWILTLGTSSDSSNRKPVVLQNGLDHRFGQKMFFGVMYRELWAKGPKCESPGHRPGKDESRRKKPQRGEMMTKSPIPPLQGFRVRNCPIPGAVPQAFTLCRVAAISKRKTSSSLLVHVRNTENRPSRTPRMAESVIKACRIYPILPHFS